MDMELALILKSVRFKLPGRYVIAIIASDAGGSTLGVGMSDESPTCFEPEWQNFLGVRLPKDILLNCARIAIHVFVDEPLARDRRALFERALPACSCSFWLPQAVGTGQSTGCSEVRLLPLLRRAPIHVHRGAEGSPWEEMGAVTLLLTHAVPPGLAPPVPAEELPSAPVEHSIFSFADQLSRLRSMSRRQGAVVKRLVQGLERMHVALDAMDTHRGELEHERTTLTSEIAALEQSLQHKSEPDLTDLDIDVLLSLPNGLSRVALVLLALEERWRWARSAVAQKWGNFEAVSKDVKVVQKMQGQLDDFRAVQAEQKDAMEKARQRCEEMARVREVAAHQQKMIATLESHISASTSTLGAGGVAEAELLLSKTRGERDSLREATKQLEVVSKSRRPQRKTRQELNELDLATVLQQRTEKMNQLLTDVRRLQLGEAYLVAGKEALASSAAIASIVAQIESTARSVTELKLQCEDLNRRADMLEKDQHSNAQGFAHEFARLKVELAFRDARVAELTRQLSSAR